MERYYAGWIICWHLAFGIRHWRYGCSAKEETHEKCRLTRSLHTTPDGRRSSASRSTASGPACVSSIVRCFRFMNNNKISRIVSAGIIGIIAACAGNIMRANDSDIGRDAYLAKAAASYDRHLAHHHSIVVSAISYLIVIGIIFAVYELIAFAVLKVLERRNADAPNT